MALCHIKYLWGWGEVCFEAYFSCLCTTSFLSLLSNIKIPTTHFKLLAYLLWRSLLMAASFAPLPLVTEVMSFFTAALYWSEKSPDNNNGLFRTMRLPPPHKIEAVKELPVRSLAELFTSHYSLGQIHSLKFGSGLRTLHVIVSLLMSYLWQHGFHSLSKLLWSCSLVTKRRTKDMF